MSDDVAEGHGLKMANEVSYRLTIEPCECARESGTFKIEIKTLSGKLIGVPLRNVDQATCIRFAKALGYAFEFGLLEGMKVARPPLPWTRVAAHFTPED